MDVNSAIEKRKSIRKYLDKSVSDKIINELIEAARLAPSGSNKQGARYRITKDKAEIDKLRKNNIYTQEFVYTAPLLIHCCWDKTAYPKQKKEGEDGVYGTDHILRGVRDLSIASSFIVLRAQELGLGTCYIGWMDKKKAKKVLNLPDNIEILFTITIGYPGEEGKPRVRKSKEEIILK